MKKLFSLLALMIATVAVVATGYTLTRPAKGSADTFTETATSKFMSGDPVEFSEQSAWAELRPAGYSICVNDVKISSGGNTVTLGHLTIKGVTLGDADADGYQSFSFSGTATVEGADGTFLTDGDLSGVTVEGKINTTTRKIYMVWKFKIYNNSMDVVWTFGVDPDAASGGTGETTSVAGTYTGNAVSLISDYSYDCSGKTVIIQDREDGDKKDFTIQNVELATSENHFDVGSFFVEEVSLTANADGSQSFSYSGNAIVDDPDMTVFSLTDESTVSTSASVELTGTISKDGKLNLVLTYKYAGTVNCTYTFEEITSGGSETGETTVAGTVVGTDGFAPAGSKFEESATIDWDKQKLVVSIDVSGCTGTNENILSIGDGISAWSGTHFHFYYTKNSSSNNFQINYLGATAGAASRKDLTITDSEIVIEISKENGLVINGEAANYGYNTTTTATPSDLYSELFALSSIQIGSQEGDNRSNATYNYMRVQDLETETPDTPTAVQYKADATMTFAGNNFDLTDQVVEITKTAENTYTVVYKSLTAGTSQIGDFTAEGVTGTTDENGTVTFTFDGNAKVTNVNSALASTLAIYGITEGGTTPFKMEGTLTDGTLKAKFTTTVLNQEVAINFNEYPEEVTPVEPTVPATDKIYLINRNNNTDSYIYEDADGNLMANTADTDNMQYWQFESTGTEGHYYIKNVVSGNYIQSTNQAENTQIVVGADPVEFEVKKPASGSLTDFYYLCSTDQTTIGTDDDTTFGLNFGAQNHNVVAYYIKNTRGNSYWALTETENTYTGKTTPDTPTDQSIEINTATGSLGTYDASLGNFASRWSSTQTEPQISLVITKTDGAEANNVYVAGSNETTIQAYVGAGSDYTLSISDGWVITGYSFDFALITSGTNVTVTANGETKTATDATQSVEVTGLEASSVVAFSLAGDNKGLNITNWKVTYKQKATEPVTPSYEPATYSASATVEFGGTTSSLTNQTVEITQTAENTYTVAYKNFDLGSTVVGDFTAEGVSGSTDADGNVTYEFDGTAKVTNINSDYSWILSAYYGITENSEIPFKMVGTSKDGVLKAKFTATIKSSDAVVNFNGYEEAVTPAEPATYEADAKVSYNGTTVDVTDQTVEITETAENTYTVVIKGITVGSNTLGDLTVEGVSGTLDEDGYINYSIENGTAVLSNVDTTTGLGFYGLIKEGQEFPFSMVGKSKDGSLVAKFTTEYSNAEVVIAYNGYTEETIDPDPEVEGTKVGTDNYEPAGTAFTWETDINWENQKLVASIDVTGCSSAEHECLLDVGNDIDQWKGTGLVNFHLYYTRSSQAAVLWYNETDDNRLQDEKSLTGDEVVIEISKENGIVINGESWNQAESDFATAYANFFALDHIQVGSAEGNTRSNAKYNYVRVQNIEKDPETAINDFNAAVANGKADIYTINGVKVNALQKGINIVRVNGKTMKVVKK